MVQKYLNKSWMDFYKFLYRNSWFLSWFNKGDPNADTGRQVTKQNAAFNNKSWKLKSISYKIQRPNIKAKNKAKTNSKVQVQEEHKVTARNTGQETGMGDRRNTRARQNRQTNKERGKQELKG